MLIRSAVARISLSLSFMLFAIASSPAQTTLTYQLPPKAIVDLVDAQPTPGVSLSPRGSASGKRWLLIEHFAGLPTIADLAQPELRLAGLRFNPKTNGPSRARYATALSLKALPDGPERHIDGLPAQAKILHVGWAPDARHIFFVNSND